ncbi:PREDICTED: uncharacterized protein LOC105362873 [Ceratosolen solmsi marchali]|uniref:Uncharacterized protein LOC105362873 n=1 Tax=Ceratosolen solmsi marchali TaxID=326594 RepID=A0AAJ6YII7_9HYME|nr:PREDICTED: uncharacterized protein LOC105362873 [Ceratosolen solmsi marchali]
MARQLFLLVLLGAVTLLHAEVPSFIRVCGRQNPQLDKCIQESIMRLMPKLKEGIPNLDVPSLEPLFVDSIAIANINDFQALATNVKLGGLSSFHIKHMHVDLKDQRIDVEIIFPKISMDSDYNVKAKIIVPINEKGPIKCTTNDVNAKVSIKFQITERRGQRLIYFPSMTTKLMITDYIADFESNDGGKTNPVTEAINSILVSSKEEIITSMTPNLEKAISEKVLNVANRICKHFTYDELFPDRP